MPEKPSQPRAQTQPGRDRDRYEPKHPAAPVYVAEELTDRYEGEELAKQRTKRPTDERIGRLEQKSDETRADVKALTAIVTETRVEHGEAIARVEARLEGLPDFAKLAEKMIDRAGEAQQHLTMTRIDVAGDAAREPVRDAKFRRKLILMVAGGVTSAGVLGAVVHCLLGKI